ncbi:M48 family metalloprotease [Patescibacteria group bacterium]|nr:M48 family metalloprotease [Patescibacteria group bacterium]
MITFLLLFLLLRVNVLVLIGSVIIGFTYVRLLQVQQLGNSLQISEKQFSQIYKEAKECSEILSLPRMPRIYVTQNPVLNAYAMGFGRSYAIVINSGVIENLQMEEIRTIIAHEMGHIKFKHTQFLSLISPLGQYFAFADLLFGFWIRKAEYTADRCALICSKDKETTIKTLIKISVGPSCGKDVDIENLSIQLQDIESNKLGNIGEMLGSHPYILKRIWEINKFAYLHRTKPCSNCGNISSSESKFCQFCGKEI